MRLFGKRVVGPSLLGDSAGTEENSTGEVGNTEGTVAKNSKEKEGRAVGNAY